MPLVDDFTEQANTKICQVIEDMLSVRLAVCRVTFYQTVEIANMGTCRVRGIAA